MPSFVLPWRMCWIVVSVPGLQHSSLARIACRGGDLGFQSIFYAGYQSNTSIQHSKKFPRICRNRTTRTHELWINFTYGALDDASFFERQERIEVQLGIARVRFIEGFEQDLPDVATILACCRNKLKRRFSSIYSALVRSLHTSTASMLACHRKSS